MSGRRKAWFARGALLVLAVMLQPMVGLWEPAGGGPAWGPGLDISVEGIGSHSEGDVIGLASQFVNATITNTGTLNYTSELNATLEVYYPANSTSMSLIFSNTTPLSDLKEPGNSTLVAFPDWTPLVEGYYAVNVSVNAIDDHPLNDSINITLYAHEGPPVDLDIEVSREVLYLMPGESTLQPENVPFLFNVINKGVENDTFDLRVISAWAEEPLPLFTGELEPGQRSADIEINVTVPIDAVPPGDFDKIFFRATSRLDPGVSMEISVYVRIPGNSGVQVELLTAETPIAFPGGDPVNMRFRVTNIGTSRDRFELEAIARPSNWIAYLNHGPYTAMLEPMGSQTVEAWISVPPLDYENMREDRTERGSIGALILRAYSPTTYATSTGEGPVVVGLLHTVQMEVTPPNATISFVTDETQNVTFDMSIRSVTNVIDGIGADMEVNLTLPEGAHGVKFKPEWSSDYNESESSRWVAGAAPKNFNLLSGEWLRGAELMVTAPRFPMQGTATATIEAQPILKVGEDALALPSREYVSVFVDPFIDFEVKPPVTDYFPEYANGSIGVDENTNSIPDWQEGAPGDVLRLPFNITNTGNTWDRYNTFSDIDPYEPAMTLPNDWNLYSLPDLDTLLPFWFDPLSPAHSGLLWVEVTVPEGTPIGESAKVSLKAESQLYPVEFNGQRLVRNASVDIFVIQGFGLDLEPEESAKSASPDETVAYRLNITNIGNGVDNVRFIPIVEDLGGWTVEFNQSNVRLDPRQQMTITLYITPSSDASADDLLSVRIRAMSLLDQDTHDDVWVNTTVDYVGGVDLVLISSSPLIWRHPGDTATFELEVFNTGNGNDSIRIDLTLETDSWTANIDTGQESGTSASVDLPRGGSLRFKVNITAPSLSRAASAEDIEELRIMAGTRVENMIKVYPSMAPSVVMETELTVGVLQDYKADIYLGAGEETSKDVLVGETVSYTLTLQNRGNGDDNLYAIYKSPLNSVRHLGWSSMDAGPHSLTPFSSRILNLSITPRASDLPRFHEVIYLNIEAMAGDNITYRRLNLSAEVVMARLMTDMTEIDLGTQGNITVRVCNMPDPGEDPIPDFTLQKSYNILTSLFTEGAVSIGWEVVDPDREIVMVDQYQIYDVRIPIRAPSDVLTNSEEALVNIEVVGQVVADKQESFLARAKGVYFDTAINSDATRFENLYEGRTGKAYITLITTGNRGQEEIPVLVKVDGDVVGIFNAGPASPQDYFGQQEILFTVEFDLPTLEWYEKGKEMVLEVIVDPDSIVVENQISGNSEAESNNLLNKEFVIKNYTPGLPVLILSGLLLLFAALAGVIGYFYMERRDSWFLVPLSLGLAGLFAMLFYVPLEDTNRGLSVANGFGIAIILIDLLLVIPIMLFLYTRSVDSYILYRINKKRDVPLAEGHEVTKTPLKPYLISVLGGLLIIAIPVLLWVIPSEMDSGAGDVLRSLFSMEGPVPVWVLLLSVPVLAAILQTVLLFLKRRALLKIERTYDDLERLKAEIEEGFS